MTIDDAIDIVRSEYRETRALIHRFKGKPESQKYWRTFSAGILCALKALEFSKQQIDKQAALRENDHAEV